MNKEYLQKVFSNERISKFLKAHSDNEKKALLHYQTNIELCESFYPIMSVLEVALRNSINRELITKYDTKDWYTHFASTPELKSLNRSITSAQSQITNRNEQISPSKVVAELTLGFWVQLFNAEYELILWKDLRRVFPFMPKTQRQRHNISATLNNFRNFRNRIFHNEPICWNLNKLEDIYDTLKQIMVWINHDLPIWFTPIDRFKSVLATVKEKMADLN